MSNFSVNFPNQAMGLDAVQYRNPSAIGANDQDVAAFDDLMNAPTEDFQSKFKNLPEFQQQQIQKELDNFNSAGSKAAKALEALPQQPQLDESRLLEEGYVQEYLNQVAVYNQLAGDAISKVNEARDAGLALFDTLEGIDPTLAKLPPLTEFGKGLLDLLKFTGGSKQQIDRVAVAFGISQ